MLAILAQALLIATRQDRIPRAGGNRHEARAY